MRISGKLVAECYTEIYRNGKRMLVAEVTRNHTGENKVRNAFQIATQVASKVTTSVVSTLRGIIFFKKSILRKAQ
jgi:hypothetical protein